jgi:hypothetical protein
MSDIVELRLTPAGHDRWAYFHVTSIYRNGLQRKQPAVNTVQQAEGRRDYWFPGADVTVHDLSITHPKRLNKKEITVKLNYNGDR